MDATLRLMTHEPEMSRPRALRWSRIAVTLVFFVNGIAMGAWSSAIPEIALKLHLDPESYGVVLGPYALGAILSMLITGWLTTRFGSRRMILVGGALVALTLLIPAEAPTMVLLAASIFVLGAANSVMDISMNAHATLIERDWESEIMSTFHSFYSFGALAGASLSGVLFGQGLSPKECLLVAMTLILLVALSTYPRIQDLRPYPRAREQRVRLWSNRKLLMVAVLAIMAIFAEFGLVEWSYKYVRDVAHATSAMATLGNGGFAAGMGFSRLIGDAIIRRIGPRRTVLYGGIVSCGGMLLAIFVPTPYTAMIGFIMAGLGLANVIPMLYTRAAAVVPTAPGKGVSVCGIIGYVGALIEPLSIGVLASRTNQAIALCLPLCALLIIAASAGAIARIKPTPHHPELEVAE